MSSEDETFDGPPVAGKKKFCGPKKKKRGKLSRAPPLVLLLPPEVADRPFPAYEDEGLVRTVRRRPLPTAQPEKSRDRGPDDDDDDDVYYALVGETDDCACDALDGMAVRGDDVFVCSDETSHLGHAGFRLPGYDLGRESTRMVLAWILCNHFNFCSFVSRVKRKTGFERVLVPATQSLFRRFALARPENCNCVEYLFQKERDYVFCLKNVVMLENKTGPTIESVTGRPMRD